ncbi:Protein odr-4 like protein [Atta colombica]|uniref:Protein odr-4 like protein n=1 Tax=Atta colombica TaxID=520822 RepID=A0A151I5S5_9HYME|nr:PREDICTED: protein odr-4 homolog [Atta colombica]XP_018058938.1 PREDICTED: protein odr-4 homolog [Atta colombica]KYM90373.1 Protein odr-4 like protein [Atta colombica]
MGRTVYVEEHLRTYLTSLAKPDGYVIGLILGQSAGQKDYIVHLAKTPPPLTKNVVEETLISSTVSTEQDVANVYIKSVKDIPMSWVADHAKHVTRMLPGGMWVLGVFIVGPEDILDNTSNVQKLKSVLGAIHKTLSWNNKYLCGNNQDEKLILSFNSIAQKYICKSIDIAKDSMLKPADWKFQEKATKWHQLETLVDFDRLYLIAVDKDPETLKKQLQNILTNIADLIESSLIVIEGEVRSPDDTLETLGKRKKSSNKECKNKTDDSNNSLQVSLYIPCSQDNSNMNVRTTSCSASIRLIGQLVSRTFVHQRASIAEANTAVKEDIVRSLASRLEMHWDSLIEEENGSPEENITLHEPPRRVLIALPDNKVTLSDYLFPGEGPQEALLSLQELLDLNVQESQVQKEVELQADPIEFYCQSNVNTKPLDNNADTIGNYQMTTYLTGLSVAFVILLVAVLVHQFMI